MKKIMAFSIMLPLVFSCGANRSEQGVSDINLGLTGRVDDARRSGEEQAPGGRGEAASLPETRFLIKTGRMTLTVPDLKAAEAALTAATAKHAGYIALSRLQADGGGLVLKVPADRFDAFITEVEALGKPSFKEILVEDVSERYFDLENRVKNKRILLGRYQEYLRRATTTKELLELEQAINNVMTEIEGLEGSFKHLKESVAYATLDLSLELPPEARGAGSTPSLGGGLRSVGDFLLGFLYHLFFGVLYTLIVALPLLFLGALVYYVGFGRVGLVLKLFRTLAPKKKSPPV